MKKNAEDKDLAEMLEDYEEKAKYRMPRRRKSLVLLTLRVPRDIKKRLTEEARKRGASGYTAVARDLIEKGLRHSPSQDEAIVDRIAKATADRVVKNLRRRRAV